MDDAVEIVADSNENAPIDFQWANAKKSVRATRGLVSRLILNI